MSRSRKGLWSCGISRIAFLACSIICFLAARKQPDCEKNQVPKYVYLFTISMTVLSILNLYFCVCFLPKITILYFCKFGIGNVSQNSVTTP